METVLIGFKLFVAGVGTALTAFWGWFGWLTILWILAMVLDYVTGTCAAWGTGTWSSNVAREGFQHKLGAVETVLVAGLLDLVLGLLIRNAPVDFPFTYSYLLCPVVMVWYILTEAGSMVENAGKLGAPVPAWLSKAIASLRDKVDDYAGSDHDQDHDHDDEE